MKKAIPLTVILLLPSACVTRDLARAIETNFPTYSALSPAEGRSLVGRHMLPSGQPSDLNCFTADFALRDPTPSETSGDTWEKLTLQYKARGKGSIGADFGAAVRVSQQAEKTTQISLEGLKIAEVNELFFNPLGPCAQGQDSDRYLAASGFPHAVITRSISASRISSESSSSTQTEAVFDPGKVGGVAVPVDATTSGSSERGFTLQGADLHIAIHTQDVTVRAQQFTEENLGPDNAMDMDGCKLKLRGTWEDQQGWTGVLTCIGGEATEIKIGFNEYATATPAKYQSYSIVGKKPQNGAFNVVSIESMKYSLSVQPAGQ